METVTEKWVCRECAMDCRIEIDTDGECGEMLKVMSCLCNLGKPNWQRVDESAKKPEILLEQVKGSPTVASVLLEPLSKKTPAMHDITLRDYFAGQALVGMLACLTFMNGLSRQEGSKEGVRLRLAEYAYQQAKAMLAEWEKGQKD